jgi:hypothetical protein
LTGVVVAPSRRKQFREFVPPGQSFSPEEIQALARAYEMALAALQDSGQPDIVHEVIAKRIIETALEGELDPAALCAVALAAFNTEEPKQ